MHALHNYYTYIVTVYAVVLTTYIHNTYTKPLNLAGKVNTQVTTVCKNYKMNCHELKCVNVYMHM